MKKQRIHSIFFLSANIRALQTKMVGTQALQKMISAASPEEAYKTVNDAGIGADIDYKDFESALTQELASTYERLEKASDDPEMFKIFRYKYDGHNLKTLIKAHVSHSDAEPLLSPLGTVDCKTLRNGLRDGDFGDLNPQLVLWQPFRQGTVLQRQTTRRWWMSSSTARCCNVCPSLPSSTKADSSISWSKLISTLQTSAALSASSASVRSLTSSKRCLHRAAAFR